ncbi:hypothetical protein EK21DRAFT_100139 [Setomelanomma holmii]|uniref:EGF-like domain-containing protein n=1 Tax=Setomelanomma holmii TaxID=210430 RepID=A0A9P4HB47_9PLEO|nr:hypothetical protein EK21DRAFT_100139 [Setomelanomma holmii]
MHHLAILSLVLFVSHTLAQACITADDCSLNGLCISTICHCDPGWIGPECGRLDLSSATRGTGYNYTIYKNPSYYNTRGNSSWGGQIVQDQDDPKLSTSSFRHNTYVHWSPADQKHLLWTIGVSVPDPTSCKSVSKDSWPNNISVSSAPSIRGPWTPFHNTINGTNPAPWPLWSPSNHTSTIALVAEDLRIFTAETWDGAYTLINTPPCNTSDYAPIWAGDPFVWRDKRGHWHALAHWMIDIVERNGTKYRRLQEAFNSTVTFTDGSTETFNRRERPKLYFSLDGDVTPLYLVTGVQALGTTTTSYTLIQPVGEKWRGFEKGLGFLKCMAYHKPSKARNR